MRLLSESSPAFDSLNRRVRELGMELFAHFTALEERATVSGQKEIALAEGHLYRLSEGAVACQRSGRTLFYLEEGEILGLTPALTASPLGLHTDFAVKVDIYDFAQVREKVLSKPELFDKWTEYLTTSWNLVLVGLSDQLRGEDSSQPDIRGYAPGERIIIQGEQGNHVFTLLEGHADVFVDEVKVGEIGEGEIFGALAALGGAPRTASVVARCDCLALGLHKDKFLDLALTRPLTVQKMVEDMAKTVVSLNSKMVEAAKIKG